jgi:hypothetical protein
VRARRVPVLDEHVEPHGSVVLVGERVLTLSAVASTALTALGPQWSALDGVVTSLEAAFGPPPDGSVDDAAGAVLVSLAALGLVEIERTLRPVEDGLG